MPTTTKTPLLMCLPFFALTGCDSLLKALNDAADGQMCLTTVLELAGITREDLSTPGADELLTATLIAQEEIIGEAYVVDCEAEESLASLSGSSEGVTTSVSGSESLGGALMDSIQDNGSKGMEVAILIDTTGSMRDDQEAVEKAVADIIAEVKENKGYLAMASYGDNQGCDEPEWYGLNTGGLLDVNDSGSIMDIETMLKTGIVETGGCNWPESMYDAVWETATRLDWEGDNRRIIAITDARPLEPPYTNHTSEEVSEKLDELGVTLDTILVGIVF